MPAVLFAFSLALVWLARPTRLAQQAICQRTDRARRPGDHAAVALVLLVLCIVDLVIVMRQQRPRRRQAPSALAPDLGRPGTVPSGATGSATCRVTMKATGPGRYRPG